MLFQWYYDISINLENLAPQIIVDISPNKALPANPNILGSSLEEHACHLDTCLLFANESNAKFKNIQERLPLRSTVNRIVTVNRRNSCTEYLSKISVTQLANSFLLHHESCTTRFPSRSIPPLKSTSEQIDYASRFLCGDFKPHAFP